MRPYRCADRMEGVVRRGNHSPRKRISRDRCLRIIIYQRRNRICWLQGGRCSRSRVRRATLSSNQHPRPSRDLRKYQQKSPQALNGARLIGKLSWTTTTTTATNKTRNSNPGQTRRIACQSSPDDANVGGSSLLLEAIPTRQE
ncbi:hypothetical protein M747DRAFT_71988 [Aspergillus niger ATCC 13496]|uniref:Uncharacterized protein n=1 Tax=Aspergillus niger ATCC 13496 TaxID=1353008 RepID=A0A370BXE9_ASPNG|nr:hypothetical protein M747DRAFT_71988 [Aspergillus niger ATCC 13496]